MKKFTIAMFIVMSSMLLGGQSGYTMDSDPTVTVDAPKKPSLKERFKGFGQKIKDWGRNTKDKFDYKVLKKSKDLKNIVATDSPVSIDKIQYSVEALLDQIRRDLKANEMRFVQKGLGAKYKFLKDYFDNLLKILKKILSATKNGQYGKEINLESYAVSLEGTAYGSHIFLSELNGVGGFSFAQFEQFMEIANMIRQVAQWMETVDYVYAKDITKNLNTMVRVFEILANGN